MTYLGGTRLSLILGVFLLGSSGVAETPVTVSKSTMEAIDSAISAVIAVESQGLARMTDRRLQRLARVPEPNAKALVGHTKASLAKMKPAKGGKQWRCMAEALYFEARGESVLGQFAVGEVILNRVKASSYPDTVCGVVKQGTGQRHRCQFSFYCDGKAEVISERKAFDQVGKVAKIMLSGTPRDLTGGATHYHTKAVAPRWSRVFTRTATIGFHHFYRQPVRVSRR